MTVEQLIQRLQEFPGYLEVLITDGFNEHCYRGEYEVEKYVDDSGESFVDIGIGGLEEK